MISGKLHSLTSMSGGLSGPAIVSGDLASFGVKELYYDTTANWNSHQDLIAKRAVAYVYSDHDSYEEDGQTVVVPAMKIGDGTSYLIDMPFMNEGYTRRLLEHIGDENVHVSSEDRAFWNNKVAAFTDESSQAETLVLSNTHYMINDLLIGRN